MVLAITVIAITFFGMEGMAWLSHKYIMHGIGWVLHKDHHEPRENSCRGRR